MGARCAALRRRDARDHARARADPRRGQPLLVDYVVRRMRPEGGSTAKTWKGWRLRLEPGERRTLTKRHSLRPVTTRRDRPGEHRIELLVNGRVAAVGSFELRA